MDTNMICSTWRPYSLSSFAAVLVWLRLSSHQLKLGEQGLDLLQVLHLFLTQYHWRKRAFQDVSCDIYMLKGGEGRGKGKKPSLKGRDLSYCSLRQEWFIFSKLWVLYWLLHYSVKKKSILIFASAILTCSVGISRTCQYSISH